ncbi:hypothetical protein ACFQHP_12075 [Halomicroarcula sp. GCM10025743]
MDHTDISERDIEFEFWNGLYFLLVGFPAAQCRSTVLTTAISEAMEPMSYIIEAAIILNALTVIVVVWGIGVRAYRYLA